MCAPTIRSPASGDRLRCPPGTATTLPPSRTREARVARGQRPSSPLVQLAEARRPPAAGRSPPTACDGEGEASTKARRSSPRESGSVMRATLRRSWQARRVRVLVTGGAGFIGGGGRRGPARRRPRGARPRRACSPRCTPAAGRRTSTPGPSGSWATCGSCPPGCSTGSTRSATRPRSSGWGWTCRTCRCYVGINDLGTAALLAAMDRAGIDRLVLASSMVVYGEGRYAAPSTATSARARAPRTTSRRAASSHPARRCGRDLAWGLVPEDAPLDPRSVYAATKVAQEHLAAAWARPPAAARWRCATTTCTARTCRRTRRTPGWRRLFRSAARARRARRGCSRTAASSATSCTSRDVARANLLALGAGHGRRALTAYNVASGTPHTIADVASR